MSIVVTGAAGFIGSAVCRRLLEDGIGVTGIDNYHPHYSKKIKSENIRELSLNDSFKFITADITNRGEIVDILSDSGADTVVHLAAEVGSRLSLNDPGVYYKVNVLGTQNVIDASEMSGIEKMIIASSSTVYESSDGGELGEDSSPLRPETPYAVSKLVNEQMGKLISFKNKMDITMLRIFSAYGPGQRPDLAIHKFMKLILAGCEIELFSDDGKIRDYVYCSDISNAVTLCRDKMKGFNILNIGSGKGVKLSEIIKIIEEVTGCKAEKKYVNSPPGHIESGVADISKAAEMIGYYPETDLRQGVDKFYNWFRSKGEDHVQERK